MTRNYDFIDRPTETWSETDTETYLMMIGLGERIQREEENKEYGKELQ